MTGPCDESLSDQFTVVPSAAGGWTAVAAALGRKAASVADGG